MIEDYSQKQISKVGRGLGTVITLQIFGSQDEFILDQSFRLIAGYEDRLTVNRDKSEVMDVNHAAGLHPVQVSTSTYRLIKLAVEKSRENFGFNALIGPVVKLWHIGFKGAHVPTDVQIKEKMVLTDPDDVVLDDNNQTVFLTKKGMELDLGGIAKGYIADRIRDLWHAYDIRAGIINLGGNVLFVGSSPRRENGKWVLGVQDPKKKRGDNLTTATVGECSAVTSGTYERFLEINGKKYHHIIDPKTGYPVQTNVAGVTLFTRDSVQAELECKRLFFAGHPIKDWKNDAEGRFGAIFIYNDDRMERVGV
ncbi:FAD:protein FMN transferase [Lactobacillus hominis]|uniref:FAD:protein FMN transferase n=1 Tax=Lactobacillus hominis DSM 23910 = CRBIP 24.179 TaxID=1423758 RepID=I7LAS4_9LACO|nr:FAD:protein FMN transferase [Lactobacillus hominis]KRM85164.1 thiamine biosynthesis membrane-associated lipoprotein [Lactobacillus hominis DSM 23910 = CRBIP 24.179]MCT3348324.1 FAD:protein FMN transferase [Lactobacillus hominis]CCI82524.1 Thiamine biosynthesis lipoprotein ApbE [Lactobacillus hominis DSM 23910 = CRBIP 24.179]